MNPSRRIWWGGIYPQWGEGAYYFHFSHWRQWRVKKGQRCCEKVVRETRTGNWGQYVWCLLHDSPTCRTFTFSVTNRRFTEGQTIWFWGHGSWGRVIFKKFFTAEGSIVFPKHFRAPLGIKWCTPNHNYSPSTETSDCSLFLATQSLDFCRSHCYYGHKIGAAL